MSSLRYPQRSRSERITPPLQPLFAKNGQEKDRFWTLENVIERLKSIRREVIEISEVPCHIVSTPEPDQAEILKLLKIKM